MLIGFQSNIKDGGKFKLTVDMEYDGQVEHYTTEEGIAIIYDKELNKMMTTGSMTTEHLENAMAHLFRAIISSHKQKQGTLIEFLVDTTSVLDRLNDIIEEEVENNGSLDGVSQEQE